MKKISIYALLTVLPLLAASCHKSDPVGPISTMRGEFYADLPGEKTLIELYPGGSQTFSVRAHSHGNKVSDIPLTLVLRAGSEMVDAYNLEHGTDYVMCPGSAFEFNKNELMMPRYGTSSTTGSVKVIASGLDVKKTYMLPISLELAKEGENFDVADTLAAYVIFKQIDIDISKGLGTQDSPFVIEDVNDLMNVTSKVQDAKTVFFKLTTDLDMTGVTDWVPVNPNNCKMDFNGDGHTISNFNAGEPLFGGVAGKIYNLTIRNAKVVKATSGEAGLVAARCYDCVAEHIYVQGAITNNSANGTGGLFGVISNATISACSADVNITSNKYYVGGIFGYDSGVCTVSDCWTSGVVKGTNRYTGGIGGGLFKAESSIYNCFSTTAVTGHYYFGGIVGSANLTDKANNATNTPNNHIEKCIAWNDFVVTNITDDAEHYSGGIIVGYTALKNYHVDCYRRYDFNFKDCPGNSGNVPCDQENSSPDKPLVIGLTGTYVFPYQGKAADADATISTVAKQLGWDENIWNLSGKVPFFKDADAPIEDPDVPSDGQLPDFDENEFYL